MANRALRRFLIAAAFVLLVICANAAADEDALARARDWLVVQQRADGAIADQGNPLFETWETVIAARALTASHSSAHVDAAAAAVEFLANQQNAQGLLCHNLRCRQATCVETSAEYLQLLIDVGQIQRARELWPALIADQQPDGRFLVGNPDVRERLDFPSVTAFVLAVGARLNQQGPELQRARDWLLDTQRPRGDFDAAWEYYGTPGYALWPAVRALGSSAASTRSARQALIGFARVTQRADGAWSFQSKKGDRHVSSTLETALMLLALSDADAPAMLIEPARNALRRMQQADGHWNGGWFPIPSASYEKREDVFATAIAILALQAEASSP